MNQVLFGFDTSFSAYNVFSQLRSNIDNILPRINSYIGTETSYGTIVHNDYADEDTYVVKRFPINSYYPDLSRFLKGILYNDALKQKEIGPQKCLELIFSLANKFIWNTSSSPKLFIFVTNGIPHDSSFTSRNLIWRDKLELLLSKGIRIGCVNIQHPIGKGINRDKDTNKAIDNFYYELVDKYKISYTRIRHSRYISEALIGVTLHAFRNDLISEYISYLAKINATNTELENILIAILKKKNPETLSYISNKYNILKVYRDITLRELYLWSGLSSRLKENTGYYELSKSTKILPPQELLSEDKITGELYDDSTTRKTLSLSKTEEEVLNINKIDPRYLVYMKTKGYNTKLEHNTNFIYED